MAEDEKFGNEDESGKEINFTELRTPRNVPPKGLQPCAGDAYLMFQVRPKTNVDLSEQNNFLTATTTTTTTLSSSHLFFIFSK